MFIGPEEIENNMELQLVSFKQAKALKELGFSQETFFVYDLRSKNITTNINYFAIYGEKDHCVFAPTLELVAKWLREEKDIDIIILPRKRRSNSGKYIDKVYDMNFIVEVLNGYILRGDSKPTYEQALSSGINKAIEILKNNE